MKYLRIKPSEVQDVDPLKAALPRRALFVKSAVDLVGSAVLAIVSLPAMAAIAVAIRVTDGSPVLFRQERAGLGGESFTMVKFRTMREPWEGEDPLTTDVERVFPLGAWLRRTSLDELPELFNVVLGQMSLVGPRPLLVQYLPKYSQRHRRRHLVRPGVTGLAQVSGRRNLTFGQRLELDVDYVDGWNLRLDARILLATLRVPFQPGSDETQLLQTVDDVGFFPAA